MTDEIPFITDDQLVDRLGRVRDALIDIGYRLPTLAREVGELRRLVAPRETGEAGSSTETADRQLSLSTTGSLPPDRPAG